MLRGQYLLPSLKMRALVSVSDCNEQGYSVQFNVDDPHVRFEGNRTLKLSERDGLFLSSSPAMDPITGSSEAELRAHLSSATGVEVKKYPANRPVTAQTTCSRTG